ncbi:MAG: hypothetical protein OCU12_07260 [Methanophagales archaeon]|nr:hypothetical protein [Methanophagales archaeon]
MTAGVMITMGREWMGLGIRFSTQSGDEGPGFSNHTGDWFVEDEGEEFLIHSLAKGTVCSHDWLSLYDNSKHWGVVAVPLGYTENQHYAVLSKAREYEGRDYDWAAIAKHFLDGMAGKIAGRPVYFFRRFRLTFWERQERYNICSWLSCWTWGIDEVKHRVVGLVRDKVTWQWWPPKIKRTYRKEPLSCEFVAPNDWERDIFVHRPGRYRVVREFGVRPKNLPAGYITKIKADMAAGLEGVITDG